MIKMFCYKLIAKIIFLLKDFRCYHYKQRCFIFVYFCFVLLSAIWQSYIQCKKTKNNKWFSIWNRRRTKVNNILLDFLHQSNCSCKKCEDKWLAESHSAHIQASPSSHDGEKWEGKYKQMQNVLLYSLIKRTRYKKSLKILISKRNIGYVSNRDRNFILGLGIWAVCVNRVTHTELLYWQADVSECIHEMKAGRMGSNVRKIQAPLIRIQFLLVRKHHSKEARK